MTHRAVIATNTEVELNIPFEAVEVENEVKTGWRKMRFDISTAQLEALEKLELVAPLLRQRLPLVILSTCPQVAQ